MKKPLATALILVLGILPAGCEGPWGWEWTTQARGQGTLTDQDGGQHEIWVTSWEHRRSSAEPFDIATMNHLELLLLGSVEGKVDAFGRMTVYLSAPLGSGDPREVISAFLSDFSDQYPVDVPYLYVDWSVTGEVGMSPPGAAPSEAAAGQGQGDLKVQQSTGYLRLKATGPEGQAVTWELDQLELAAGWQRTPYPSVRY